MASHYTNYTLKQKKAERIRTYSSKPRLSMLTITLKLQYLRKLYTNVMVAIDDTSEEQLGFFG